MTQPRVFVVNEPLKHNKDSDRSERMINLEPAQEYGTLVHLLPAGRLSEATHPMVLALREQLSDFSDNDYLLPVGDPVAICLAAAFAAAANEGRVKYLRWRRGPRCYAVVSTTMWSEYALPMAPT
jgi:hypothetical protein